jgi:hypothetical protein
VEARQPSWKEEVARLQQVVRLRKASCLLSCRGPDEESIPRGAVGCLCHGSSLVHLVICRHCRQSSFCSPFLSPLSLLGSTSPERLANCIATVEKFQWIQLPSCQTRERAWSEKSSRNSEGGKTVLVAKKTFLGVAILRILE